MPTITEDKLRKMIAEELKNMHEQVDHEGVRKVVNNASKLLKALESFKGDATGAMSNALTPHLDAMHKALEDMISTPGSYVDKPKAMAKTVKLRAVKEPSAV